MADKIKVAGEAINLLGSEKYTSEDMKKVMKPFLSPKSPFKRVNLVITNEEYGWLLNTVRKIGETLPKVSTSQMVRIGIELLREKTEDELIELIRSRGI